jgi:hypothetical protein
MPNAADMIEKFRISAAELAEIYHGCVQSLSYVSTDCNVKLHCKLFEDSPIATKIRCG